MTIENLGAQIDVVEQRLRALGAALLANDVSHLERAGSEFHACVIDLARLVMSARSVRGRRSRQHARDLQRLKSLRLQLVGLREQLVRLSSQVERALQVVVPRAAAMATYEHAGRPFAAAIRPSGSLGHLTA